MKLIPKTEDDMLECIVTARKTQKVSKVISVIGLMFSTFGLITSIIWFNLGLLLVSILTTLVLCFFRFISLPKSDKELDQLEVRYKEEVEPWN